MSVHLNANSLAVRVACCPLKPSIWNTVQRTCAVPGIFLAQFARLEEAAESAASGEADVLLLDRPVGQKLTQRLWPLLSKAEAPLRLLLLTNKHKKYPPAQGTGAHRVFQVPDGKRFQERLIESLVRAIDDLPSGAGAPTTEEPWWEREVTRPGVRSAPRLHVHPRLRVKVRFCPAGGTERHYGALVDISSSGFRAELPPGVSFATGTPLEFCLLWPTNSCSGRCEVIHLLSPEPPTHPKQRASVGVQLRNLEANQKARLTFLLKLVETRGLPSRSDSPTAPS